MSPVEELVEAFTEAGLTFGRPATQGHPEVRVKSDSGRQYAVCVLRFSFMVAPESEPNVYQRLTVADVLDHVRNDRTA
jgi:hypothetical protein